MAAIGMLGKGTILEFGTVSGTYGSKLANLIDCTIPGWMCDVIDVTHNDSSDSPNREKLPGLHDHEPLTATFIFTRAEYIEAFGIKGAQKFWELTLSDAKYIRFSGFINKISSPVPMADKLTFDIEITVDTGTITIEA